MHDVYSMSSTLARAAKLALEHFIRTDDDASETAMARVMCDRISVGEGFIKESLDAKSAGNWILARAIADCPLPTFRNNFRLESAANTIKSQLSLVYDFEPVYFEE